MGAPSHDLETLKSRLETTWSSGDYGHVARYLEDSAAEFLARIPVEPGERVLDVACGSGQASLPLARAGARVTGIDIAAQSIEQARVRARDEGLEIRFDVGDAESLPYEDRAFDLVISLIGVMFAPRPQRAAAEMLRVCRAGGRIVMANWTPEGFIGEFLKTVSRHAPPPAGMPSPLSWGEEETVRERLGSGVSDLRMTRRIYPFAYPFPPEDVCEHYLTHYGPTRQAAAALDGAGREALRRDVTALWADHDRSGSDDRTYVDAEILEVVAVRR